MFGVPVEMRGKSYTVVVKGVSLAKQLTDQNRNGNIRVVHTTLPRRVGNEKMKSTLYVSVETIE